MYFDLMIARLEIIWAIIRKFWPKASNSWCGEEVGMPYLIIRLATQKWVSLKVTAEVLRGYLLIPPQKIQMHNAEEVK